MSVHNNPVISHEGTSIRYTDEIDLQEQPLGGTRSYLMRDWLSASVSISCSVAGVSGNVAIEQGFSKQGPGAPLSPAANIALVDGIVTAIYGVQVHGQYLILNFGAATIPGAGKLYINVLGKRG